MGKTINCTLSQKSIQNAIDEIKSWEGSFSFIIIDRLERDIYAITDRLGSEELYELTDQIIQENIHKGNLAQ